ncbi:MAG TPA: DUF4440 domain-containing protein [Woeseiaceae bacterium]|nr:DUF4440 domain-containing protein [Woeseiaceae bacterium]
MKKTGAILPLALILSACGQPAGDGAAFTPRDTEWQAAMNAGDVEGIAALYADDARLMPPNLEAMTGKDAVRAAFGGMIEAGQSIELMAIEHRSGGDVAHVVGTFKLMSGDDVVDQGKYIETWQRNADGEWLMTNDIWNSDKPAAAGGGVDDDDLVAYARAAAPAKVAANATIVVDGAVAVEGNNGWTCMPDTMPGDRAPICIDDVWAEMMTAVGSQAPYEASRIGISYMLQGEPPGSGVSNSTPYHPDHRNADDYVETGPHLMVIAPKELIAHITDDPSSGGPYVMWKDTDYAHIMIPVE